MIRLHNVSKIYRTEHVETHALSGFSLHVEPGEFLSVMGPSAFLGGFVSLFRARGVFLSS